MLIVMPSDMHDALVSLVRIRPELVPFLLHVAGHPVPDKPAVLADSHLPVLGISVLRPADLGDPAAVRAVRRDARRLLRMWPRYADAVVTCGEGADKHVVVCEIQTSKPSPRQRRRQHAYLANAADLGNCDAFLLTLTVSRNVAAACRLPFLPGQPGLEVVPIVMGPDSTPLPGAAGASEFAPELAILGVLNRNLDIRAPQTRRYVLDTIDTHPEHRGDYAKLIWSVSPRLRKTLEEEMTIHDEIRARFPVPFLDDAYDKGMAEGLTQGMAQGLARGKAEAVLNVLTARGIAVPADTNATICACMDLAQLDHWMTAAMTAEKLSDVFVVRSGRRRAA